jgi:hypothetical protein
MRLLAPALAGSVFFFVVSPALADDAGVETVPAAPPEDAPPAFAVHVVPSPWAPPPPSAPRARDPLDRRRLKLGLLIAGTSAIAVGGGLLAAGAYLLAHPPVQRDCFVALFGCPRAPDKFPGEELIATGALITATGIPLASVGLALPARRAEEPPPRASFTLGAGSARLAVSF